MLKIMIVDDDFIVRRGMCDAIAWDQYDCKIVGQANDGQEALELILQCQPDVIFCDVVMPRMNGIALLAQVKQQWPWIKMVMISAHDEAAYVRQALQQDAVDYLLKPFHEEEILRVLHSVREKISKERITLSMETSSNPQLLADVTAHARAVGQALRERDGHQAVFEARAMFYAIRANGIHSKLLITSLCVEVIMDAIHFLQAAGLPEQSQRLMPRLSDITRYVELGMLEEKVVSIVEDVSQWIGEDTSPALKLVTQACRLIEAQYTDNLTVSILAGTLHVSPNYLQKLFKQETGHTIRQHIITVRMEKAKELLRTTREKVYTIADAVGYQDVDFFSQTFVRIVGMTPQQYRETHT